MLGAFAVGKTSLVRRFVHSIFSEKYHTTIGVKIDKKPVEVDGREVELLLWDIHGEDDYQAVRTSYLSGMSGYLLVADGTRGNTLETALALRERAEGAVGRVPFVLLVNKADLGAEWEIEQETFEALRERGCVWLLTSAKTGENVDEAFQQLASMMMGKR